MSKYKFYLQFSQILVGHISLCIVKVFQLYHFYRSSKCKCTIYAIAASTSQVLCQVSSLDTAEPEQGNYAYILLSAYRVKVSGR